MKKTLFLLISICSMIILVFNNCGEKFESANSLDESSIPFEISNKTLAGRYHTYCKNTSAADGGPSSSTWTILVIEENNSFLNYKVVANKFAGSKCNEGEFVTSKTTSSGIMILKGNKLDITSTNNDYFFGNIKANETLYTTIALDGYKLNFVKTREGGGKSPSTRLSFDMIRPAFTFNIEAGRLDPYKFPEDNRLTVSFEGKYITEKSCEYLNNYNEINDLLTTIDSDNQIYSPGKNSPEARIINGKRIDIYNQGEDVPLEELFHEYQKICKSGESFAPNQDKALEYHNRTIRARPVPGTFGEAISAIDFQISVETRELNCINKKVFLKYNYTPIELEKVNLTRSKDQDILKLVEQFCSN